MSLSLNKSHKAFGSLGLQCYNIVAKKVLNFVPIYLTEASIIDNSKCSQVCQDIYNKL